MPTANISQFYKTAVEHTTCNGACDGLMPHRVIKGLFFQYSEIRIKLPTIPVAKKCNVLPISHCETDYWKER